MLGEAVRNDGPCNFRPLYKQFVYMLVTQPASPLVDPTRRSTPYMLTPNVCRDVGWGWEVAGRKEVSCATILKVSAYWKVQTEHKTLQINIQVLECSDTNVMPVC